MKKILAFQASWLILCAPFCITSANAEDPRKPAEAQMQIQSPQQFVRNSLVAGQKEVRLGELALQKSDDPQVKGFARDMVQDHSKLNMELKEIAQRKGLDVPKEDFDTAKTVRPAGDESAINTPAVGSEDRTQDTNKRVKEMEPGAGEDKTISPDRRLEGLTGVEFDRTFINVMVDDHKKAVNTFDQASKNLADSELRAFASKALPTLRMHLDRAEKLERQYSSGKDDYTQVK